MGARYSWQVDDPDAGLIEYELSVDDDGSGVLAVNGQGHLPIPADRVPKILEGLGVIDVEVHDQ